MKSFVVLIGAGSLLFAGSTLAGPKLPPEKIVSAKTCAECHQSETTVWKKTPHFQTYKSMHKKPEAKAIAEKLGLKSIKRGDTCLQCHYTQALKKGKPKAVSGISCESCHGAGADWVDIHNDYGGSTVGKDQESDAHRAERWKKALAAGMLHPSNIYLVAQNCYGCHTVPHEELVNKGGHKAGSASFELVAWSQGMVRHNFTRGGGNQVSPPERLRLMYVVGALVNLEYSLRAAAKATAAGPYATATAERVAKSITVLEAIQAKSPLAQVASAIAAGKSSPVKPGSAGPLEAAADKVGQQARSLSEAGGGAGLAALDGLLPSADAYK